MSRKNSRSVDPRYLVGDHVIADEQIERLFRLLRDNPHLSAAQLIELVERTVCPPYR
jgi:hypothetical protein